MSSTFTLYTTDSNLLRCQVEFLTESLRPLDGAKPPGSVGLGYVEADNILLRKKPGDVGTLDLGELVKDVVSDTLFVHLHDANGTFTDEDAMPMRHRRWMFAHQGDLGAPSATRAALLATLPDFLARQVRGHTATEACFLAFMKRLRDEGRMDDFDVAPQVVGRLLGQTVRQVEKVERNNGVARTSGLMFFASNGRVTVASRLGAGPLYYSLIEGVTRCRRCDIDETTSDSNPLLRSHRRVRAVALATDVTANKGRFIEVPEGAVISIGRTLDVHVEPLPPVL